MYGDLIIHFSSPTKQVSLLLRKMHLQTQVQIGGSLSEVHVQVGSPR